MFTFKFIILSKLFQISKNIIKCAPKTEEMWVEFQSNSIHNYSLITLLNNHKIIPSYRREKTSFG